MSSRQHGVCLVKCAAAAAAVADTSAAAGGGGGGGGAAAADVVVAATGRASGSLADMIREHLQLPAFCHP